MLSSATDSSRVPLNDVLIVEAQLSARKALERMLEGLNLGLRFRSVSSAAQAQQEAQSARPDLILSSLSLPDQTGLELCRSLSHEALKVVLLGDVPWDEAQAAGAAGLLGLPLEQGELSSLLDTLFTAPSRSAGAGRPTPTLAQVLLLKLLERPGVLAISAYGPGGELVEEAGEALPPGLGARARRHLESARWLNQSESTQPGEQTAAAPLCTIQVEYGQRCLLLFEQPSGVIACLLRDSASASLMKYWLRSAR
jgi:CheY-like chemotaxis protein